MSRIKNYLEKRWNDKKWLSDAVFSASCISIGVSIAFVFISDHRDFAVHNLFQGELDKVQFDSSANDAYLAFGMSKVFSDFPVNSYVNLAYDNFKNLESIEGTSTDASIQSYDDFVSYIQSTSSIARVAGLFAAADREDRFLNTLWYVYLTFNLISALAVLILSNRLSEVSSQSNEKR